MAQYGKLVDEGIQYLPNTLVYEGVTYVKFDGEFPAEVITGCGYKEIINTDVPQTTLPYDYHWNSHWVEGDDNITLEWFQEEDDTTPIQRRQNAYATRPLIEYGNGLISVDEARGICEMYQYDGTEEAAEIIADLSAKIAVAKASIREEYPYSQAE